MYIGWNILLLFPVTALWFTLQHFVQLRHKLCMTAIWMNVPHKAFLISLKQLWEATMSIGTCPFACVLFLKITAILRPEGQAFQAAILSMCSFQLAPLLQQPSLQTRWALAFTKLFFLSCFFLSLLVLCDDRFSLLTRVHVELRNIICIKQCSWMELLDFHYHCIQRMKSSSHKADPWWSLLWISVQY